MYCYRGQIVTRTGNVYCQTIGKLVIFTPTDKDTHSGSYVLNTNVGKIIPAEESSKPYRNEDCHLLVRYDLARLAKLVYNCFDIASGKILLVTQQSLGYILHYMY